MLNILPNNSLRKRPSKVSRTRIRRQTPQLVRWSVNKNLLVTGIEVKHV